MPEPPNVFISWSEERSKKVALALRDWLPDVIQEARPWMSASDIDRGARWAEEIASALATTKAGIICLTRENLTAPWLLFEAGALAKTNDPKTRIWTYMLDEIKPDALPGPLKMFQATPADKPSTHDLLRSINRYLDEPISTDRLDRAFEKNWNDLDKTLKTLPKTAAPPPAPPDPAEMAEESLEILRTLISPILETANEIEAMRKKRIVEESQPRFTVASPLAGPSGGLITGNVLAGTFEPGPAIYGRITQLPPSSFFTPTNAPQGESENPPKQHPTLPRKGKPK